MNTIIKTTWRHEDPEITKAIIEKQRLQQIAKNTIKLIKTEFAPLTLNGVVYATVKEAVEKTSINETRIRAALRRKATRVLTMVVDPKSRGVNKTILIIDGITYHGYDKACEGTGKSLTTLKSRVKKYNSCVFKLNTY